MCPKNVCALSGPRGCSFFVASLFFLLSAWPLRASCFPMPSLGFVFFFRCRLGGGFFLIGLRVKRNGGIIKGFFVAPVWAGGFHFFYEEKWQKNDPCRKPLSGNPPLSIAIPVPSHHAASTQCQLPLSFLTFAVCAFWSHPPTHCQPQLSFSTFTVAAFFESHGTLPYITV